LNGHEAAELVPSLHPYSDTIVLRFADVEAGSLTATGITDATGNLSERLEVRLRIQPYSASIVINELLYEPIADPFDGRPDQVEFIELKSLSPEPLDISHCALFGPASETGEREFLNMASMDAALSPHGFVTVVANGETDAIMSAYPDLPLDSHIHETSASSLRLTNSGSLTGLACPDTGVIDSVSYSPAWHDDTVQHHRGRSLERIDPLAQTDSFLNWTTSRSEFGATPGRMNSIVPADQVAALRPSDLIVNEIMFEPRNDGPYPQYEYVELKSVSDRPVELNGLRLLVRSSRSEDSIRVIFRPTVVKPGDLFVIASGPSDDTTDTDAFLQNPFPSIPTSAEAASVLRRSGLSLPNSGADIDLLNAAGRVVESASYSSKFHHPHLAATRGVALERISDNASGRHPSNWTSSVHPEGGTPGVRNSVASTGPDRVADLLISPSPFFPDRDGDRDHAVIRMDLIADRPMVRVTIFDSRGRPVRHLTKGTLAAAEHTMVWDGSDDRGVRVRPGIYIVFVEATDIVAQSVESMRGIVVVG
ncbi:MAG: lamin tail domain-containing protein, partial [Rhodothermales bacterium]|nr:lamin tail domain-containing protein [Rhodothermales bacterium]